MKVLHHKFVKYLYQQLVKCVNDVGLMLPVYLMCVCVCVCVIDMCLTISVYCVFRSPTAKRPTTEFITNFNSFTVTVRLNIQLNTLETSEDDILPNYHMIV